MRKVVFLAVLAVLCIANVKTYTQTISGVNGIPLILYTCEQASRPVNTPAEIAGIKALNPDLVIFANITDNFYNTLTSAPYSLKLIPNQNIDTVPSYKITQYCDAYYSEWEAEGNQYGSAKLYPNSLCSSFTDVENNITRYGKADTTVSANLFLSGPGYYQDKSYNRIKKGDLIVYTLDSYLKIYPKTGKCYSDIDLLDGQNIVGYI